MPLHYALDLKPDLETLKLAGSETIEIEITEPTNRIVLNAVNMSVERATVEGVGACERDLGFRRQGGGDFVDRLLSRARLPSGSTSSGS